MIKIVFALLLLSLFGSRTQAQQPTFKSPLLDHLVGHWVLTGTVVGTKTVHDVDGRWVLEHQYLFLHEVSREKNSKGEAAYAANFYLGWDQMAGQYVCVCLDVYGNISSDSIGRADAAGDTIAFVFHYRDGSLFLTTFTYDKSADNWTLDMDSEKAGKKLPFARTKLTRA